jgi:hypothetical protein
VLAQLGADYTFWSKPFQSQETLEKEPQLRLASMWGIRGLI